MLIINENDKRLLNMKAKLLEVTVNDNENILADYEKLALDIDNDCYNQIVDKIKRSDYNNQSLEDQIKFLSEIEGDYNYLNQLQWMIRKTYSKYTDHEINLNDINNILIDKIIERISDIQGYLVNNKNLDSNKMEIDRLNTKLISLDKKYEQTKKVLLGIRGKIRNDIISAEGRVYDVNGDIRPISIVSEFKNYQIDLRELLNNQELLDKLYKQFKDEYVMQEEKLEVTINLPCKDQEIYHEIELETIRSKYKYKLVQLIHEVCLDIVQYDSFKDNLYEIADIVDEIKVCLKKIGIRFYINPFDRIKLESQIQVVNSMTDYQKEIDNIKKTITYISEMIEETAKKNRNLVMIINDDIAILNEPETKKIDASANLTPIAKETFADIVNNAQVRDNQVIKIDKLSRDFKIERVKEKTSGVIKRVFEMFNVVPINDNDVKNPELLLTSIKDENTFTDNNVIPFENTIPGDIALDFPVVNQDIMADNSNKVFPADVKTEDNSANVFLDTDIKEDKNDGELFQEVTPFESTPLFSERYESEIFDDKKEDKMVIDLSSDKEPQINKSSIIELEPKKDNNPLDSMMPEAFWVTKEDDVKEEDKNDDNVLSFDEQVAALIDNNDMVKVKKKAV